MLIVIFLLISLYNKQHSLNSSYRRRLPAPLLSLNHLNSRDGGTQLTIPFLRLCVCGGGGVGSGGVGVGVGVGVVVVVVVVVLTYIDGVGGTHLHCIQYLVPCSDLGGQGTVGVLMSLLC